VGAAIARMSSSGQAKVRRVELLELVDQLWEVAGVGCDPEVLGLDRPPAKSSGVIDGNMASASAGMPSLLNVADATTTGA
jgi:hypothetical protein